MRTNGNENSWEEKVVNDVDKAFELLDKLAAKRWFCRGQSKFYDRRLIAPIDRYHWNRAKILSYERQSLIVFRSAIRYFSEGEKETQYSDIPTLMLMQHHLVPTRLIDWSQSPFIAMYFAVSGHYKKSDQQNGEIWAFDYHLYEEKGPAQWVKYRETTKDGTHFDESMPTIFRFKEPKHNWVVLQFIPPEFSRIAAQQGLFSVTSKFGIDHARAIQDLLENKDSFCKYIIDKKIKKEIRNRLKKDYGIWEGSLFPDSSGVAGAVRKSVFSID
jgi:hypothetical protein